MKLSMLVVCAIVLSVANADVQPQSQDDAVQADPNSWPGWPRPIWQPRPPSRWRSAREEGIDANKDQDAQANSNSWPGWPRPGWPRPPWRLREQGMDADKDQNAQRSLAVEESQREAVDSLQGADFESDFESWLSRRGQADDAMAADSQLARVRQLNSANQKNMAGVPEASNYDVVATPMGCVCLGWNKWSVCVSWGSCPLRRGRLSLGGQRIREIGNARASVPEIIVLGSVAELKLYSDPTDRDRLFSSPVARAELVSRPLDPATPGQVSDALGGIQHAVVATLTDGRRFFVVKGNQKGEGSETIVILADHMTDDWTKVTTKDVSQSTLGDFVKAGGASFDALKDNGKQAALRMMALP